jgi:MEMO1 family protein
MAVETLPRFREDVQVSVYSEGNASRLLLQDPLGIADGPVLLHVDMIDILEACDGQTTVADFAAAAGVEPDSADIMRLRAFLGELSRLGFLDDDRFHALRTQHETAFGTMAVREPVCAGSSYPADPDDLRTFLTDLLGPGGDVATPAPSTARGALIPHIDLRVAPQVYGPSFEPLRGADADLFICLGTSHYWWQHQFILTDKDYVTPLGRVRTDRDLVQQLRERWTSLGSAILAPTDMAHKPEHSLEYHLLGLQHLVGHRPFTVLPILVAGLRDDDQGAGQLAAAIDILRDVVDASGKRAFWLISGYLAHVGRKFGDDEAAIDLLDAVRAEDAELLRHLAAADAEGWRNAIERVGDRRRICGLAPVYTALRAFGPSRGTVTAYDVWDEQETHSAVTFAGVSFE